MPKKPSKNDMAKLKAVLGGKAKPTKADMAKFKAAKAKKK